MAKGLNFDLDDPLGDILSDGSDDSFFGNDDDVFGSKPNKKENIEQRKSSIFNLETELKVEAKPETKVEAKQEPKLTPNISKSVQDLGKNTNLGTPKRSESILDKSRLIKSAEDKKIPYSRKLNENMEKNVIHEDIFNETDKKKKQSNTIFDDILGASSAKTKQQRKETEFDFDDLIAKPSQKKTTASKPKIEPKRSLPKEKTEVKITEPDFDWLDKPKIEAEPPPKKLPAKKQQESAGLPSWLLGESDSVETKVVVQNEEPLLQKDKNDVQQNTAPNPMVVTQPLIETAIFKTDEKESCIEESTALCLKQEEQHLMIALQLKAQEEKLAALQARQHESSRVQKELVEGHQSQMSSFLKRQIERRKQMQDIISNHQEKINQRIKSLLLGSGENLASSGDGEFDSGTSGHLPKYSEKKQLLQLIETLQSNHDREVDLLETTYRKQLSFLELSANNLEDYMREEKTKLIQHYNDKLHWYEEQHGRDKTIYERNIQNMQEMYQSEMAKLRTQHETSIEILQEQHKSLVEHITNSVKTDQKTLKNSTEFSQNIIELVSDVRESKTKLEELVSSLSHTAASHDIEKERSMVARERQVDELLQQVKIEKQALSKEHDLHRETNKQLEEKFKMLNQNIQEESAELKKKRLDLENEKYILEKQQEFQANQLKKQEEILKLEKEEMLREHETKLKRLEDERDRLKSETESVLLEKGNVQKVKQEAERMKCDLLVQLQQLSDEKSRINIERQNIAVEEQKIILKSRELDTLTKNALEKQSEAEKKMSESEVCRRLYESKVGEIQEYANSLTTREKNIAREKVTLSRERLNLHNERRKQMLDQAHHQRGDDNRYIYGSAGNGVILNNLELDNIRHIPPPRTADEQEFVDPKMLLLKLDIEKVLKNLKDTKGNERNDSNYKEK